MEAIIETYKTVWIRGQRNKGANMILRCPYWVTRRTTVLLRNQKARRRVDFPGKASGLGHAEYAAR